VEGIEVTKPPWPFLWMFALENWFGLPAILWGAGVLFALLVLLPFIDRSPDRSWRRRRIVMVLVALLTAALIALTIIALVTTPEAHL
jgi:ubiquinol-cytochrome c reductase cytochrome b subunit